MIDARSNRGATALHLATAVGDVDAMRLLLARGADIEARNDGDHRPLHLIARGDTLGVVRVLLGEGAQDAVM